MSEFPGDIYTEPESVDVNTLANLGPLTGMAGVWEGARGLETGPFHHVDRNTLPRIAAPTPNPLARVQS